MIPQPAHFSSLFRSLRVSYESLSSPKYGHRLAVEQKSENPRRMTAARLSVLSSVLESAAVPRMSVCLVAYGYWSTVSHVSAESVAGVTTSLFSVGQLWSSEPVW